MKELNDTEYLRNLAERLMHIPIMHGTDQRDISRLERIAKRLARRKYSEEIDD